MVPAAASKRMVPPSTVSIPAAPANEAVDLTLTVPTLSAPSFPPVTVPVTSAVPLMLSCAVGT